MGGASDRSVRERVQFYLLDHETRVGKTVDVSLLVLNVAFLAIVVLETYRVSPLVREALWGLEVGIVFVLSVEYVLRLYGAPDRVSEAFDPYTVVDLLSIVPTLAVLVVPSVTTTLGFGLLRVVRVVRVLSFYRFTRDEEFFFGTVSGETLRVAKLLLTVLTIVFLYAGLFFSFEHRTNPGIATFGDAFYFSVVSLTTVGYGDITPTTSAGRSVTVAAILVGVVVSRGRSAASFGSGRRVTRST